MEVNVFGNNQTACSNDAFEDFAKGLPCSLISHQSSKLLHVARCWLASTSKTPATTGPTSSTLNPQASPAWLAMAPTSRGKKLVTGESSEVTLSTTPDWPGCIA